MNVWENYDFEKIGKEEQKLIDQKFDWFINIIKEEIENNLGSIPELEIEPRIRGNDMKDWADSEIKVFISRSIIFTVYLKNNLIVLESPFSNTHPLYGKSIKTLKFDPKLIFKDYVRQMINDELIPNINDFYKRNLIKKMPEKLVKEEKDIDFSKLTSEWLIYKFHEISEDVMNGETIENVRFQPVKNNGIEILFDVDCDRYGLHRNCSLEINSRGHIKVRLDDTPVEGAGIESGLKKEIEKLLGINH